MTNFGERLRSLRKEYKLSQKAFGEKFGLAESTISMYERNERQPDFDMLNKFADYLNVQTDYLLGRTDNKYINNDDKEFQEFMNDPKLGHFFKEMKDSPEEQVEELRKIWGIINNRRTTIDKQELERAKQQEEYKK